MRSFIKFASLAVLALLLTLTLLGLMSATTTALTFADANPIGEEPLAYDGPLSTLAEGPYPSATEAEDLDPRADEPSDAAPRHSICRPGHRLCGWGSHHPWCCLPGKVCSIGYRGCCPLGYPYVCSGICCKYGCTNGGKCACGPSWTVDCGRGCCRRRYRCLLGKWCVPRFFRSLAEGPGTNAVPTENRTEPIQAPGGSPPTSPEAPIANT
ncbi:hypothetical protein BKA57DRAFT_452112 [Linnemannia elongata]|nr:hypothetical protein BKA57DRAFT_452112 [Linnemannia elongata]